MYCYNCGGFIPEGRDTCPNCGATQSQPVQRQNSADAWAQRMRGVSDPLRKIYKYRVIGTIVAAAICAVTVLYLFALINGVETIDYGYWGQSYVFSDTFKAISGLYAASMIVFAIVGVIVTICMLITFNDMKRFEDRFSTVFTLALLSIISSLAESFCKDSFKIIVSLADLVIEILMYYHLYGAMADITRPLDRDLASKWDTLFRIFVGYIVLSFIAGIVIVVSATDYSSLKGAMFFLTLVLAGGVAMNIYELTLFKASTSVFERLERSYPVNNNNRWDEY